MAKEVDTKKFWKKIALSNIYDNADMSNDNPEEIDAAIDVLLRQKDNDVRNLWILGCATLYRETQFLMKTGP